MPERKPIFYDQERRRWRRTRRVLEITGGFLAIVLVIFLINVGRNPELPDILKADTHAGLHAVRPTLPLLKPKPTRGRKRKIAALGKIPQNYDPVRAAFYEEDDASSLAALQLHYKEIDLLIPDALHAAWPDGHLEIDRNTKLDAWMKSMQPTGLELPVMSMVNNYNGKDWAIKDMADMLAHPAARDRLTKELTDFVKVAAPARPGRGF